MSYTQKLELNWIGKHDLKNVIRPEPRILIEKPEYSYQRTNDKEQISMMPDENQPQFDNMLIHGDNLLALKALESEYAGEIKCIYIDPPYNTGSAFEHYDDNLEHSTWLNLMKPRLELLRTLLSEDGSIWISIDDNEYAYLKVLCDEVFGRVNFVATITVRSSDNSNNDAKQFSLDHNYIIVYSRKPNWRPNKLSRSAEQAKHYNNPDNDPRGPWFDGNPLNSPNPRPNLTYDIIAPNGNIIKPPFNGWRWSEETLKEKMVTGEIRFNADFTGIKRRTYLYEQDGIPPSTLWADLDDTGHNRQAKYEQKNLFPQLNKNQLFTTPKPEKLLQKILTLTTNPGDIVLDSFLGSGTTAAVAHKMGRKWIGIELGEHAYTHCYPRLKAVVDGEQGGISKAVNFSGGGGFKFYELAPTLIEKSPFGNPIISKEYDTELLAQAVAKHEGYSYNPNPEMPWKQCSSGDKNFLFTTTSYINEDYLEYIHSQMKPDEHLLICAKAFSSSSVNIFHNITLHQIPKVLLGKCDFTKENYNFNITESNNFEDIDFIEEE